MSGTTKIPYEPARQFADMLQTMLVPGASRAMIAGSIRRQRPEVGDIELVVDPLFEVKTTLFGEEESRVSLLDMAIAEIVSAGLLEWDTETPRNGKKLKRFKAPALYNTVVELYIAQPGNYGNLCAIRTGPFEFSRLLMTPMSKRGGMPAEMEQKDGFLYRNGARVTCNTERTFFREIDVPNFNPVDRSEEVLRDFLEARRSRAREFMNKQAEARGEH